MVSMPRDATDPYYPFRVIWTRGNGCGELASLLGGEEASRVTGDLKEAAIAARADLTVARKLSSFDLTSLAVPHDFEIESTDRVVALVAGGPHSLLAARVAASVGSSLGVPASSATAFRSDDDREAAEATTRALASTGLAGEVLQAERAAELAERYDERTLLVIGAAGGGFLRRLLAGPGARLRARAPAGVIVVRSAPERVFQSMDEPVFVGVHLSAADAAQVTDVPTIPVVDDGKLVGLVDRETIRTAPSDTPVAELMASPTSVRPTDELEVVRSVNEELAVIPVADRRGRLLGSFRRDGLDDERNRRL